MIPLRGSEGVGDIPASDSIGGGLIIFRGSERVANVPADDEDLGLALESENEATDEEKETEKRGWRVSRSFPPGTTLEREKEPAALRFTFFSPDE